MSANLAPVVKTMHSTFVGGPASGKTRKECWKAKTTDGRFLIERLELTGTPWEVYELVDGKPVRSCGWFGTLRSARVAITAGRCETVQYISSLDQWVTVDGGSITGRFVTAAEARASLA